MKQDQAERKRKDKLTEKLSTIRAEDRKKSREIGKKPFYLKKSAIKEIALEQRYICVAYISCIYGAIIRLLPVNFSTLLLVHCTRLYYLYT